MITLSDKATFCSRFEILINQTHMSVSLFMPCYKPGFDIANPFGFKA
ncbi:hypothetical protein A6A12_0910 [Vibrio anguillarum]|nr:hypothetical protein A6A12_0910 [Vibrio anguillarum]